MTPSSPTGKTSLENPSSVTSDLGRWSEKGEMGMGVKMARDLGYRGEVRGGVDGGNG